MLIYNPNKIHNSEFIIVITSLIYNSELFERSSHQYVIIMITDVA